MEDSVLVFSGPYIEAELAKGLWKTVRFLSC